MFRDKKCHTMQYLVNVWIFPMTTTEWLLQNNATKAANVVGIILFTIATGTYSSHFISRHCNTYFDPSTLPLYSDALQVN